MVSGCREFYIFTNMFPNYVEEAMPFVNDWRTNIELKISFPSSYGYATITPGKDSSGIYVYNRTCLSDVAFLITNALVTHDHKTFRFSAKPTHKRRFPALMAEFEAQAIKLFPAYNTFLSFKYPGTVHVVTLPGLNIRPMVLSKAMCIFDQDWVATQAENYRFFLGQCFLHQFFIDNLLPHMAIHRFVANGLFNYYSILSLGNPGETEARLQDLFLQVMRYEKFTPMARAVKELFTTTQPQQVRIERQGKLP